MVHTSFGTSFIQLNLHYFIACVCVCVFLCETNLFRALHISMVTSTDSAMVMGYGDSNTWHSRSWKSGCSGEHCKKWLWEEQKEPDRKYTSSNKTKEKSHAWTNELLLLTVPHPTCSPEAWPNTHQLVEGDLRPVISHNEPPGCSSHSSCSHIAYETQHRHTAITTYSSLHHNFSSPLLRDLHTARFRVSDQSFVTVIHGSWYVREGI